ncbi:MAG TPA: magnesium transporter CorA family protein [Polyangiaceae bacterium]
MLKHYWLQQGKVVDHGEGPPPVWVYVDPDEAERRQLIEDGLDEHTLVSALDPDELARLEWEPDHVALIYKRPSSYQEEGRFMFRVASTGLFLFKDRLVLVQAKEPPSFEGKLFARITSLRSLVLRLISRAVSHYLEHLKVINLATDELEAKVNASLENRYLIYMFVLQKSLVYYLSSISSNGGLIERLRNNAVKLELGADGLELLEDLSIENTQCYKQAEIYSSILASLMDARASIVSNNLNVLMKTLNMLTITIMVPTFVVSAFSMNVPVPLSANHWAFWFIMALATLSSIGWLIIWKRWRWL